jgi:Plasmid pRiA4b ORF-3-like protein
MPTQGKSAANEIYQVKITLFGTEVWRRMLVPASLTLANLHHVIQVAMGWEDGHLHEFRAGTQTYGPPKPRADAFNMPFDMPRSIDERKVQLHQVLGRVGARAVYTYDFGDSWEHGIVLEKRLAAEPDMAYPVCTGGQYAGPPEDCGGVPGFFDLVEAIQDPQHARHEEILEWVGADYDPQEFSMEKVNRALHRRKRAAGS